MGRALLHMLNRESLILNEAITALSQFPVKESLSDQPSVSEMIKTLKQCLEKPLNQLAYLLTFTNMADRPSKRNQVTCSSPCGRRLESHRISRMPPLSIHTTDSGIEQSVTVIMESPYSALVVRSLHVSY